MDYTYLLILFYYNYFPEKNGINRYTNQQDYRGIFVKSEINDNVMSFRSSAILKRPVQFIYIISNHPIQKLYNLYLEYDGEEDDDEDNDEDNKITTNINEEDDEYIKSFKEKIQFCTEFIKDDKDY